MAQKIIVVKIGGSILSPNIDNPFNFDYALRLKKVLTEFADQGYCFILVLGGGAVARRYMGLAREGGEVDIDDLHRIGLAVNNLHAQIMHGLYDSLAYPQVLSGEIMRMVERGETEMIDWGMQRFVIAGGATPGVSGDWNAVKLAEVFSAEEVIILKDVDGIYTADPNKDSTARHIAQLSWLEYFELIGNPDEHVPGAHFPIDIEASRLAAELGQTMWVVGSDLDNLRRWIQEGEGHGTRVTPAT